MIALAALQAAPASAQTKTVVPRTSPVYGSGSPDYANATPMALPLTSGSTNAAGTAADPVFPGAPMLIPGKQGTGVTHPVRLVPPSSGAASPSGSGATPLDVGTGGVPYTTARVDDYGEITSVRFPYSASGKLFFSTSKGTAVCSASLIKPGIVVTAAHCVAQYGKREYFTNFSYVPSYDQGEAPFGTWSASSVTVSDSYYGGGDECADTGVVCTDDIAIMTLLPNASGVLPGPATGHLSLGLNGYGFVNKRLVQITQLGYPVSLDSGERMQRNDSQGRVDPTQSNNTLIGSLMTGGSSGGPWIVNWGQAPTNSGPFGISPARNIVVGVTSWGYTNPTTKIMGASPFTSANVAVLLKAACTASPGNC